MPIAVCIRLVNVLKRIGVSTGDLQYLRSKPAPTFPSRSSAGASALKVPAQDIGRCVCWTVRMIRIVCAAVFIIQALYVLNDRKSMDFGILCMYDQIMKPFRMAWTGPRDPVFAALVVGYRQPFPEPVDDRAGSWFCFIFHQPARVGCGAGEVRLPAGGFLLVGPGDQVQHRADGSRLERSWLRFEGSSVPSAIDAAGLARRTVGFLSPHNLAVDGILSLHRAMLHSRGVSTGHLQALFMTLLHILARDAGGIGTSGADIASVRRHIEATFMLTPRLDDLASMAGCSRAQFCRRFRTEVGMSSGQYVLHLRLEFARELLCGTDRPIEEIASACGFTDRFHFSRIFARESGEPPAAFRRHRKFQ